MIRKGLLTVMAKRPDRFIGQVDSGRRRRLARAAMALVLSVAMPLMAPAAAFAGGRPLVVRTPLDVVVPRPLLTGVCNLGHDIFLHIDGTFTAVVQFDETGAPIREEDTGLGLFTFFVPDTGRSVSYRTHANLRTTYFSDGTAIATVTGVASKIHQPGGAPLLLDTGRTVFSAVVVDTTPEGIPVVEFVDVLSDSGTDRGDLFEAICAVLGS